MKVLIDHNFHILQCANYTGTQSKFNFYYSDYGNEFFYRMLYKVCY